MGKTGGFMEFGRKEPGYRPREERIKDYRAVERRLDGDELYRQAARCMDCGIPFCQGAGCPVGNVIPEFNHMVYEGRWQDALDLLLSTDNFPEFTGRICPALCEESCVLECSDGAPVAIREIELAIIEKGFERGYMQPRIPAVRSGFHVAVVGSGPAGLAAADTLNHMGHEVTVYDEARLPGGILRYGVPDFKLEKWVIDRRIDLMKKEGVVFESGVTVGVDVSYRFLDARFDAVCLTVGARQARDLPIPGRELAGVHFAMDFLTRQNRLIAGEVGPADVISAKGLHVVVIGGGDTGSDCVGTSNRHGALSVTQLEIMPKPPDKRSPSTPWPLWPLKLKTTSSHEEGCERHWSTSATEFVGEAGHVRQLKCVRMEMKAADGRTTFTPVPGSEFVIPADLVLLAMGFVGPVRNAMFDDLALERDGRGNVKTDAQYMTSRRGVFAAGDARRGQSLVVWALAEGRTVAERMDAWLRAGPSGADAAS